MQSREKGSLHRQFSEYPFATEPEQNTQQQLQAGQRKDIAAAPHLHACRSQASCNPCFLFAKGWQCFIASKQEKGQAAMAAAPHRLPSSPHLSPTRPLRRGTFTYNNRHRSCQRRAPISWSLLPFSIPAGGLSTPTSSDPSPPPGPALVQAHSSLLPRRLHLWRLPACLLQGPFLPGLRWFAAAVATCWLILSGAGGSCNLHFGSWARLFQSASLCWKWNVVVAWLFLLVVLSISPPSATSFLPSPASKGGANPLTLPYRLFSDCSLPSSSHSFFSRRSFTPRARTFQARSEPAPAVPFSSIPPSRLKRARARVAVGERPLFNINK